MALTDEITMTRGADRSLVTVDHFGPELESLLRTRLAELCWGDTEAHGDPEYFSLSRTAEEFLERFYEKTSETQTGMLGELLSHLLVPLVHPELERTALLFNKEERNIKKGFDLTFRNDTSALWYGEVKSGALTKKSAGASVRALLSAARKDLFLKLTSRKGMTLWQSAAHDAHLVLGTDESVAVKHLYRRDEQSARRAKNYHRRAVLVAVLFHPVELETLAHADVKFPASRANGKSTGYVFDETILVAIQKSTLDKLVVFIQDCIAEDSDDSNTEAASQQPTA